MKMQERILAEIERRISVVDEQEAVQSSDYANTGTLYAMRGWETLFSISYAFNPGYCSLTFAGSELIAKAEDNPPTWRLESVKGTPSLTFHHLDYDDSARMERMFAVVDSLAEALTI